MVFPGATDPIVGWDPLIRAWSTAPDAPDTVALPAALVGTVRATDDELRRTSDDSGHLVHHRPRAVCRPDAAEQVADLLAWADRQDLPVAARGSAHSLYGQAQVAGGIVLDMRGLGRIERVTGDRAVAAAGATWADVVDRAAEHGLTPPVLTDYLGATVGGTLSVGGVGGASHRWGLQVDQVTALQVATPRSGLRWCSPEHDADVFDAVRAGHGQIGVITAAELVLVPAPERVRRHELHHRDLTAYLDDQRRLARERCVEYLEGQAVDDGDGGWSFLIEAVGAGGLPPDLRHVRSEVIELGPAEFAHRVDVGEAIERASGVWSWPHPCVTAFVPDAAVADVAAATLAAMSPADLGPAGLILLYPVDPGLVRAPLARLPGGDVAWLFSMLRKAPPDRPEQLDAWTRANRAFLDRVRAAGGFAYPINALAVTPEQWRDHLGERWPFLARTKEVHDPRRILAPGVGMFPR